MLRSGNMSEIDAHRHVGTCKSSNLARIAQ